MQWMGCEGKRTSWIARATTVQLTVYTLGLVLLSKLLRNYRGKLADEGLTRRSLLLAYLRVAD